MNGLSVNQDLPLLHAKKLNISLPTVSQNLALLGNMGLICSSGEFQSTGGRKANMLSIVPTARYAVGVDITSLRTVFLLTNLNLNIVDKVCLGIEYGDTPEYYQTLNHTIGDLLERNGVSEEAFLGVGISVPAPIEENSERVPSNTIIGLPVDFSDRLKRNIHYPFHLINDADAAGWAELWQLDTDQTMAYLSLSYTVGGAIILKRHVYPGDKRRSAEFGHMTLYPRGRKCYCGKRGCVDAYCAEKILSDFTGGDIRLFFDELKSGNEGFQAVFQQYLKDLAVVINNLKMCFDCVIVLGGTLGYYLKDSLEKIRSIACSLSPYLEDPGYIRVCELHEDPSAVGAALYYVDQFINSL